MSHVRAKQTETHGVSCVACHEPITGDGAVLSGAAYHRACRPKRPWVRPTGCECDATVRRQDKCTAQWMRCSARINYVMRAKAV
jgi:hypothetical protein